MLVKSI
jgi:hypothetical protein